MSRASGVAVLDVGKTNIKLSACDADGRVQEVLSCPNRTRPGPPWRHHDLSMQHAWVPDALARLRRRHEIGHFITAGHGVGAVMVGADPGAEPVLPMIDYEQPVPCGLNDRYARLTSDFFDRGSVIMHGATHIARQILWAQEAEPAAFARVRHVLGLPQYWAWRLCGRAVSEISHLGAQSHLWNIAEDRASKIVTGQGWGHLIPERAAAWEDLGPVRPALAAELPDLSVHTGVHDSSANLYRYQAAGLANFVLISTGTWIVAMADNVAMDRIDPDRGMTLNADVTGAPILGALCMGGREFAMVAGPQPAGACADPKAIHRLIRKRTMALPTFGENDGQVPGSAGRGRIIGPPPEGDAENLALAVLYSALLTSLCADAVAPNRDIVLDGVFVRDPAFAALIAALHPDVRVRINAEGDGVAAGCALLCRHTSGRRADLNLITPKAFDPASALHAYAADWRMRVLSQPSDPKAFP